MTSVATAAQDGRFGAGSATHRGGEGSSEADADSGSITLRARAMGGCRSAPERDWRGAPRVAEWVREVACVTTRDEPWIGLDDARG